MDPLNLLAVKEVCRITHNNPTINGQFGDRKITTNRNCLGSILGDLAILEELGYEGVEFELLCDLKLSMTTSAKHTFPQCTDLSKTWLPCTVESSMIKF